MKTGNDNLDTIWGEKAYEYYSLNPKESSIKVGIEITAKQKE